MHIRFGHLRYEVLASDTPLIHPETGAACLGLAWPDRGRIQYDASAPVERRWGAVCHELGHLLKADLDITGALRLDEESMCNLFGLAMSMLDLKELIRLYVYVTQDIDAPAAMMLPNVPTPIPVMRYTP